MKLMLLYSGLFALALGGCSLLPSRGAGGHLMRVEASPERCTSLDDRQSVWGSIGAGAGLLSGGAGLSTIAVANDNARIGLAISSAVLGAIAAGSEFFARSTAQSFVREGCGDSAKLFFPHTFGSTFDGGVSDVRSEVQ